jgi:hypothetical protein
VATTPHAQPPTAARRGPSPKPLPDFEGVDVAGLARSDHAVLGEVAALLLRNWPSGDDAVAYYEDGPGKLMH